MSRLMRQTYCGANEMKGEMKMEDKMFEDRGFRVHRRVPEAALEPTVDEIVETVLGNGEVCKWRKAEHGDWWLEEGMWNKVRAWNGKMLKEKMAGEAWQKLVEMGIETLPINGEIELPGLYVLRADEDYYDGTEWEKVDGEWMVKKQGWMPKWDESLKGKAWDDALLRAYWEWKRK